MSLCDPVSGFPCWGLKRILPALKKQISLVLPSLKRVVQPSLSPGWRRADLVTVHRPQGGVSTGSPFSPQRDVLIKELLHQKHGMQEAASTWIKIQERDGGRESTWQGARRS